MQNKKANNKNQKPSKTHRNTQKETTKTSTAGDQLISSQASETYYKGGPNSVSKNHINFRYQNELKTSPLCLLGHNNLSLSVLLLKEVPCFQSLQSRRFEARRGLAEATPRTQNVLAQGQSEAYYGDSKLYNTIVEVPARLNLK